MKTRRLRVTTAALAVATLGIAVAIPSAALPLHHTTGHLEGGFTGEVEGTTGTVHGSELTQTSGRGPAGPGVRTAASGPQYRTTLGCGNATNPDSIAAIPACTFALVACVTSQHPDSVLLYLWTRPASGGAWTFVGQFCSRNAPAGVSVPAVPSMTQIVTAFRSVTFAKPRVHIQPEGNVTLVNLPTYYEAQWPADADLVPGEVSAPQQLLSWRVEFRVTSAAYRFDFGDGSVGEWTTDPGGPYPSGGITHVYAAASPGVPVRVDARVRGAFRVNGGEWVDLNGEADLTDEPVTILVVKEARTRLVSY